MRGKPDEYVTCAELLSIAGQVASGEKLPPIEKQTQYIVDARDKRYAVLAEEIGATKSQLDWALYYCSREYNPVPTDDMLQMVIHRKIEGNLSRQI